MEIILARYGLSPLLVVLLLCSGQSQATEESVYLAPQQMVEVELERQLNLVCTGEGAPTVVFDSGVAEPASAWFLVQPRVAEQTRTCSYDRAGVGFSDGDVNSDGSSKSIAADLKRLLTKANIEPPYVLVGHSYGGMNVRMYYYMYPEDVAGIVLVDPSHEDQTEGNRMLSPRGETRAGWVAAILEPGLERLRKCFKVAKDGFEQGSDDHSSCVLPSKLLSIDLQRAYLAMQEAPAFHRAQLMEQQSVFGLSVEQLRRERRGFQTLPVFVLTQSAPVGPLRTKDTERYRQARYNMWLQLHIGLANTSTRGVHRVIPESNHVIQLVQPKAVIKAIGDVLATIRQDVSGEE